MPVIEKNILGICISERAWNYRFVWPEREIYIKNRDDYLRKNKRVFVGKEAIYEELVLRLKFAFETCLDTNRSIFDGEVDLKESTGNNDKVPLQMLYDDEVLKESFDYFGKLEKLRFVQLNKIAIEKIATDLIGGDYTITEKEKYLEDWCQDLEAGIVQELAHVLFLEDVLKSGDRKKYFLEQMANYPNVEVRVSDEDRQTKYLSTDIEQHGRRMELDFLSRIYPTSWTEAWVKHDLSMVSGV
ncbi:MAG: hypothetical protein UX08_C0019G0012 [Candidatus Collierbacteria bacterium GW2011_GWB1_45_35]|uniref:Uncharacterized protein n=2 Tax=Candidatus Collieribacteriota TaxID=1752725 RepID=A0A0G1NMS0_9BACT|nr:MAG: hypothetical protein UW48_C0015G0011 [Microgenomates group bacterium GW2011_GWC1_44_23]KKT85509.1 MAG: hypothetical protein UW84_C0029G0015 [Candidatus Collierbacteria bacterium GW2011_GWA2_44_99]KKT95144.1 MAG: hypothetical protein UW96_C0010G0012 [Candidatus Collierbacteria bacterium GW2011_GWA1_45_15]KKU00544.1 MAG: hypothetical protein UX01_C0004G0111 [Candidatus Collierbacteria bacterium GW2011_GWB2_45_17]KKU04683.1 MAG: hypothetical protein UX08_C0019G0012 [Candidatus Collierbacte